MTVSEFETFENELLAKLKKESKKCLKIIEKNEKLIDNYLNGSDLTYVKKFVNDFNDVVLDKKIKKYKLFEAVLNHKLFTNVLTQFRESDVLIRACKDVKRYYASYEFEDHRESINKNVIEWLLTMNINYGVKDELGMTALMYAVKSVKLDFAVKKMMNGKHIYLLDNDGNNVLFHATENFFTLEKFVKYKDVYDGNHLNNNNENLLLHCSKNKRITSLDYLVKLNEFNCSEPNLTDNEGKTAAMYLVERGRYKEIQSYVNYYKIDPNYVSKFGHSLVSVLIQRYYLFYTNRIVEKEGFGLNLKGFKRYALTFEALKKMGCNFNIPVDEDGTTVDMILSKLHDELLFGYLFIDSDYIINVKTDNKKYKEIDLSDPIIKNNHKSIQMWLREALNPEGTINTQRAGLIMLGLFGGGHIV